MKIHIDTSGQQSAQPTNKTQKASTASPKAKPSKQQPARSKSSLPKKPPKEPTPPKDVVAARKRQSSVIKARQGRELRGHDVAVREQAGIGFWPAGSPFL
jgi:hypothetical protein